MAARPFGPSFGQRALAAIAVVSPGMSTQRGLGSRRLADKMSRSGKTGFVLGYRMTAGATLTGATADWYRVEFLVDGGRVDRRSPFWTRPVFVERAPGPVRVTVVSLGSPPFPTVDFVVDEGHVLLVEAFPERQNGASASLVVRSSNRDTLAAS